MVVDEAHRTAGVLGKPWAVVHDDRRLPAVRRLYMTATPRLWEVPGLEGAAGGAGHLVASMDDEEIFGPVVYRLTMSEAIERGLIAQYQVVCVDIADPQLSAVRLVGAEAFTDEVRGVRLAALQTAVLKAAAEHRLQRVLTFHHRTSEAEAFAGGLGQVAAALWEADAGSFAEPEAVWADWLCGEHRAVHRRRVLETFSAGVVQDAVMELCVLSSARVLGEGVDTATCDAVVFVDARGSTPDVVQAVGRALRMQPGEGKVASLVVPVFLEPGEEPDEMLASRSYTHLVKVLTALRAHDTEAVEQLAVPQSPSRQAASAAGGTAGGVASGAAQGLLRFSTARDPVHLAAFIRARVLRPEGEYWRRGCRPRSLTPPITGTCGSPTGIPLPMVSHLGCGSPSSASPTARAPWPRNGCGNWMRPGWCGPISRWPSPGAWPPRVAGQGNTGTSSLPPGQPGRAIPWGSGCVTSVPPRDENERHRTGLTGAGHRGSPTVRGGGGNWR